MRDEQASTRNCRDAVEACCPQGVPVAGLGAEQQAGALATHLDVHPPEPCGHRAWGRGDDDEAVVTVGELRDLPHHRLPG
ncbi:MAG: hypothetical protein WBL35_08330 [Ornithinibacter sp.]